MSGVYAILKTAGQKLAAATRVMPRQAGRGVFRSVTVALTILTLLLLCALVSPALAADLPPEVPPYNSNGTDNTAYRLHNSGTTFTVEDGFTYTLAGLISGTGGLTKTGTGTLVLSDAHNIYTGNTTVNAGTLQIATHRSINPNAIITVTGDGSELKSSKDLAVGFSQIGALSITNKGKVSSGQDFIIGFNLASSGTVLVDGVDSTLTVTRNLDCGYNGTGVLTITNGATVSTGSTGNIYLGRNAGVNGAATVSGENSTLTASTITVGSSGTGVLYVTNKGKVRGTARIRIGTSTGSSGRVLVDKDSEIEGGSGIYVGGDQVAAYGSGLLAGSGKVTAGTNGVRVYSTGSLSAGDAAGAIGELDIVGDLDLRKNATLHVDFNNDGVVAGTNQDHIDVTGNVTLGTNLDISLSSLAKVIDTTTNRTIVTASGTMSVAPTTATLLLNGLSLAGSRAAGSTVTLGIDGSGKQLQITSMTLSNNDNKAVTWSGPATGDWDITTTHWHENTVPGTPIKFLDGDAVTFNNTAAMTVDIKGTKKTVAQMLVTGSGDLTINGDIHADGTQTTLTSNKSGKLLMQGTGKVILNADANFVGGIDIDSGTLVVAGTLGNGNYGGNIVNAGALVFDQTAIQTLTGVISGTGTLTKNGGGTLTLSGANTYTGATTVAAGTIKAGSASAFSAVSVHTLQGSAVLDLDDKNQTIAGLASTSASSSVLLGSANLTIDQASNQSFAGVISGTGKVIKNGTGTLTLAGSNTYTGGTTLTAGRIDLGTAAALGTGALAMASGTTVGFNANNLAVANAIAVGGIGTFDTGTNNATLSGVLTGTGTVVKNGTGTLTYSNATPYMGNYTINAGTYQINPAAGPYPFINVLNAGTADGTLAFELGAAANALTFGVGVGDDFLGTIQLRKGTLNLNSDYIGDVFKNATLKLTSANSIATLTADQTLKGLSLDGGNLRVATTTGYIAPSAVLTVTDLSVTSAGGTLGMNVNADIDTNVANYGSFYDYSGSAEANQKAVVAAANVTSGAGTQLTLTAYDGSTLPSSPVTRTIKDGLDQVGTATFDYIAQVVDSGTNKGVYLGYGLTELASTHATKAVELDGTGATGTVLNAKLTGTGAAGFTFSGAKDVSVGNANSDYSGATLITGNHTVAMLTDSAFGKTSSLNLTSAGKLDMAGKSQTVKELKGDAGTEIKLGALTTTQTTDSTFAGVLSNASASAGSLTKEGAGKLTLSGLNTYTGPTSVAAGILALGTGGSIANSSLFLGANGEFDISAVGGGNSTAIVAGMEVIAGAGLTLGTNALDLTGDKDLVFDLNGITAGGTVLNVTGTGNGLVFDADTKISLKNVDDGLKKDDTITLATIASGPVTDEVFQSGRKKYVLEFNLDALLMRIAGISSFVESTNDFLGSAAPGNVNIENGGAYLDWLLTQPYGQLPDPGMEIIEDYFTDITDNLTGRAAYSELERFYGSYSAYGNQALQDDANRFRRRWRKQNHFFLDGFVFTDLLQSAADSGVASDSGLASPRYGARDCVPTGASRVWAGGFGTWSKQDSRSNLAGYDYDSYGLALGYEYTRDRLRLGVAAAYSRGDLEVDALGYENKPDVLNLALYGAYVHDSGLYAEGGLGYGHAWNDYDARMQLGGVKTGKYGSDVFSADFELGYIARLATGYNLIPSLGLEYDYIRNDSWTEKVVNSAAPANRFASGHDHALDIPVGFRANKALILGGGTVIVPEIRASYVYTANKSTPTIRSGFAGAPGNFTVRGVDPGRSHWRFGAGLSGQINRLLDFHVEYEFETRSGYKGHNVNASVGVSF